MKKRFSKDIKIFHGPANIGGLGRHSADYQRKQGHISDFVVFKDDYRKNNSHYDLHLHDYRAKSKKRVIHLLCFLLFFLKYDLFNFYYGVTLLPFNLDLPLLKLFGKKIVMTYCGSEIRLIEVEKQRNPYFYLLRHSANHPKYDRRKKFMMRWQSLWVDKAIAIRDLTRHARTAYGEEKLISDLWINNVFDDVLEANENFKPRDIPIIIHAPNEPNIKGTAHVEKAINELRDEGLKFEYKRLQNMPSDKVQPHYRDCDIIVDQLLVGSFGNLAVEGMYYGKPVVGYIIEEVENAIPDLPIVNANVDNVKDKIRWLIENPQERLRLGQRGREFYKRHFNRDEIQDRLLQAYQSLFEE